MYIPDHFSIKNLATLHGIIQSHPLGVLVSTTPEGLDANHIPFELDPARGLLTAHVATCAVSSPRAGSSSNGIWLASRPSGVVLTNTPRGCD